MPRYHLQWKDAGMKPRTYTADNDAVAVAIAHSLVKREIVRRRGAGVHWRLDETVGARGARQGVRRIDA